MPWSDVTRSSVVLTVLLWAGSTASSATEDWRWKVFEQSGKLRLLAAQEDGTDFIGAVRMECERGSGRVLIEVEADREDRAELAAYLTSDVYPEVTIGQEKLAEKSSVEAIAFNDLHGWLYTFASSAGAAWFNEFRKSGTIAYTIAYTIGKHRASGKLSRGLDMIARFQDACRKPARRN